MTAAHDQSMTIHVLAHVPEHAPREDDPHYHLFEQAKTRLKRQGLWKCAINDDLCGGQLELHHSHVEFSQANAVDPAKIEKALGLHFDDDEAFQAWIESPGNLEVLCLPGDEPVLMEGGSSRPIRDIRVGDRVIGHDTRSHPVIGASVSEFVGELVAIDGHRMTGNHPVLTARGWVPAVEVRSGDLACFVAAPSSAGGERGLLGMLDADVFSMTGIEPEVFRSVVGPVAVDVVDRLAAQQGAPDLSFHHEPMLQDVPLAPEAPVDDPDVSGPREVASSAATLTRNAVERGHPTGIGAVAVESRLDLCDPDVHLRPTLGALDPGVAVAEGTATFSAAFLATRCVPLGEFRGNTVLVVACRADLDDAGVATTNQRRWRPVLHVETLPFSGKVYDIEVAGSQSFVTSDLVVHNCVNHHRTHYGVHVIPSALWETLRWHRAGQPAPAEFVAAKDLPK